MQMAFGVQLSCKILKCRQMTCWKLLHYRCIQTGGFRCLNTLGIYKIAAISQETWKHYKILNGKPKANACVCVGRGVRVCGCEQWPAIKFIVYFVPQHRNHFFALRCALRKILAQILSVRPDRATQCQVVHNAIKSVMASSTAN